MSSGIEPGFEKKLTPTAMAMIAKKNSTLRSRRRKNTVKWSKPIARQMPLIIRNAILNGPIDRFKPDRFPARGIQGLRFSDASGRRCQFYRRGNF
jgi:hypothetical protein